MKKHKFILNQLLTVIAAASFTNIANADWSIAGNKILDPNGNPFVYRGINVAEKPTSANVASLFRDVAATGANAIRIPVYSTDTSLEELRSYIQLCRENKLVCVLTHMEATGYGDLASLSNMVNTSIHWVEDAGIKQLLEENQDFVIINLANEPAGNDFPPLMYLADMKQAITLVRQLGLKNQIMIDGGTWGQDWQFTMHDNAEQIMAADPLKNLIFSVHMYEAYNDPVVIRNYLTSFTARNLPIVVGEFAPKRKYRDGEWKNPFGNSVEVAEDSIMEIAQELGVGYLGWAWAGNRAGFTDLDMVVNWNPLQLTPWGDFFINSSNGIKATSKLATHYFNSNVPPIANFTVNASPGCMEGKLLLSAQGSYDPDGDQLSYEWSNGARGYSTELTVASGTSVSVTLKVTDATGMSASFTRNLGLWFFDSCSSNPSSSSSSRPSSSVPVKSSSSIADYSSSSSSRSAISSSRSSVSSSSSSITSASSTSSAIANAKCSYVYNSQWNNGFTAAIRIQNISAKPIVNWSVNWEYVDGSRVTNLWNATLSGNNPYTASNLSWNSTIQPGQTVEFGFQGSKSVGTAVAPIVRGAICQ